MLPIALSEIETLLPIAFAIIYLLSAIAGIFKKKEVPQPGKPAPPPTARHTDAAPDDDDELKSPEIEPTDRDRAPAPRPQPDPVLRAPPQPAPLRTPPLPLLTRPVPEERPEVRRRVSDPRFEIPKPRIVSRILTRDVPTSRIASRAPEVHIHGVTPASDDPHSLLHPEGAHLPLPGTDGRWRRLLRESDGLRNAVVLAEILAPPLALRDNHLRGAQ